MEYSPFSWQSPAFLCPLLSHPRQAPVIELFSNALSIRSSGVALVCLMYPYTSDVVSGSSNLFSFSSLPDSLWQESLPGKRSLINVCFVVVTVT